MSERCETCADWKRMPSPDEAYGECWSGDRLDGDMTKGPAGTPRGDGVCEAWRTVELGDVSDAYLAENNLSRDQWEAMVAKELGKLNPRQPSQRDLFA